MNEFDDMGDLEFKYDVPEDIGVYVCVESDRYDEFMNNPLLFRLEGLKEVFIKKSADGRLYAAGEDITLIDEEFYDYVWARRCDYS